MKKYKLTDDWKNAPNGEKVYRIEALIDFTLINGKKVKIGDKGGWVSSEHRLSHEGLCWIYDNCMMYEQSYRSENSIGFDNSCQFGNSQQFGNSLQCDNSRQYGFSKQGSNCIDTGNGDVIHLISPTSKREITIAISDRSVATGCFSGSSHWLVSSLRGIKVPEWARWLAEKLNTETDAFLRENLKKEFKEKFL